MDIDIINNYYFSESRLPVQVDNFLHALSTAYIQAGLQAYFYEYRYSTSFCNLPKPALWIETAPVVGGGSGGGASGGGASGRGDYDNNDTPETPHPNDSIEEIKKQSNSCCSMRN